MSDYAQQLETAICQTLELWTRDYPTAWPVLDVLGNTAQKFVGDGGKVLEPWYSTMTPEWVEYANGRLAALTPLYYKDAQITEAIHWARKYYPLKIHEYFKSGDNRDKEVMEECLRECQAADRYFPEHARACSIPLVKMGA